MFFFDYLLLLVGVLLGLAFFTLVERKVLGYFHFRKGPRKLFYFGLLQPIRDAVKLFSKESLKGFKIRFIFFVLGPMLGLFLIFILWVVYLNLFGVYGRIFSLLYIFGFLSLGVYFLLFCGWGSNRKYAMVGGYRGVSQTVSYEVTIIFFILGFVYFMRSFDIRTFFYFQFGFWFGFFRILLFVGWIFVCLAELNRTPFDFSEGESELVSGFNVDYRGGLFSFVFICEYGIIIFLGILTVSVFFGAFSFLVKISCFCFFVVLVRCTYPRYRYDFLMYRAWKVLLPFSLVFLILFVAFYSFLEKFLCKAFKAFWENYIIRIIEKYRIV